MIWRWFAIVYGLLIVSSCGSKREFIITDDYVSRELGTGTAPAGKDEPVKLSDKDKAYFAVKLGVKPSDITNERLYAYIKEAAEKNFTGSGVLVSRVYADVYGKKIAVQPADLITDKRLELFKSAENLREGDLVFFRASSNEVVTHVGVYLKNNRFLSAQNNKAAILNLKKGTWKNNFTTAGRLK